VGVYLKTHPRRRGEQKALARTVRVSTRTLRTWRRRAGRSGSPGRPPHSAEARALARAVIEPLWSALPQGHNGWRTVLEVLERKGIQIPTRLVQESVRVLKREAAAAERRRIEKNRVHVDVHARNALWALDQTHLMHDTRGGLKSLAVRDCVAPHVLGLSLGPPACGQDVVRLLVRVAAQRDAWPLVIQLDNGSENRNAQVGDLLRARRVIALWNQPRTPQHNPRIERSIGSLKCASGLDESDNAATREHTCARLFDAWDRLDARTPRASLGGLTPVELDAIAPEAEDFVRRDCFYTQVSEELRRIALVPLRARARRKAEREAIWCALQTYGLVTRTRGGCLVPTAKAEGIS
jgi:transposase InsO family protein